MPAWVPDAAVARVPRSATKRRTATSSWSETRLPSKTNRKRRPPNSKVAEARTDLGRVLAAPTRGRVAHDVFGFHRGRHILRTPVGPIGLDGDAPGSRPRADQVERDVRTGIGEQSCALADDEGICKQL